MIEKDAGACVASFFKDQRMWLGFAVPFILLSLNALNQYFPFVPGPVFLLKTYLCLADRIAYFADGYWLTNM